MPTRDWQSVFQPAALDPSRWLGALQTLADATSSSRAQLIGIGAPEAVPFNWVTGFPSDALADFVRIGGGSAGINYRINADREIAPGAIAWEEHYRRARPRLSSDVYLDFCQTYEIPHGCQTALVAEEGSLVGLALLRTDRDGPTSVGERAVFAGAIEAARGAVRLQRAIEQQGLHLALGTLEAMTAACLLLDGFGRVGATTPAGEAAVTASADLGLSGGRLVSADPVTQRRLGQALRGVLERGEAGRVPLRDGRRVDLFPLPRRAWTMSFAPAAIAVVRDTAAALADGAVHARAAFGLSQAEFDVGLLMARGRSRAEIASARRVSAETLKSQVKALYAKTGCSREGELIALLASFG